MGAETMATVLSCFNGLRLLCVDDSVLVATFVPGLKGWRAGWARSAPRVVFDDPVARLAISHANPQRGPLSR